MSAYNKARRELFLWQTSPSNSFYSTLFDLIAKATRIERSRLAKSYPEEVRVYEEWCYSDDPKRYMIDWIHLRAVEGLDGQGGYRV